jgi:hypothetical protein
MKEDLMQLHSILPKGLVFGDFIFSHGLGMVPLLAEADPDLPAIDLLHEALGRGGVNTTEISDRGEVSRLVVENGGDRPVLILEGEELVGGRQNRIVNTTIMIPAGESVEIPVS